MHLRIDLSGTKDIDLIALRNEDTFNIEKAIYKALKYYANGEKAEISIPAPNPDKISINRCSIHLYLNEKSDKEICELIDSIPDGYKAFVVKCIFRNYIAYPAIGFLTGCNPVKTDIPSTTEIKKIEKPVKQKPVTISKKETEIIKKDHKPADNYIPNIPVKTDNIQQQTIQNTENEDTGNDFSMFGFGFVENY